VIVGSASLTPYNEGYLDGAKWAANRTAAAVRKILESPEWRLVANQSPPASPEVEALRKVLLNLASAPHDPRCP
jgi:hypothetical protein